MEIQLQSNWVTLQETGKGAQKGKGKMVKQAGAKVEDGNSQKQVTTTFPMGNFGNRGRNWKR